MRQTIAGPFYDVRDAFPLGCHRTLKCRFRFASKASFSYAPFRSSLESFMGHVCFVYSPLCLIHGTREESLGQLARCNGATPPPHTAGQSACGDGGRAPIRAAPRGPWHE
ncbi:hypothetical protein CBL_05276 [Carabus blaptoides fortunei]